MGWWRISTRHCRSSRRNWPRSNADYQLQSDFRIKIMAQSIRRVGIIGAGQMGTGIAHVCSLAGMPVVINDIAAPRLKEALATINGNMARQVSRKRITEEQKQAGLKLISTVESYDGL